MKSVQIKAFIWDIKCHHRHHYHHHHPANMMIGHLLIRFGVTRLELSFMVSPVFSAFKPAIF
jgi:hypothetical protein